MLVTDGKPQTIGRFKIEARLGSGGFGTVYKAYDTERNTSVALKTLHNISPETVYLFKQEFRSLAEIVHTNLVSLYELMSDGEQWFFTMELVEGVNFLNYVREIEGEIDSSCINASTQRAIEVDKNNEQANQHTLLAPDEPEPSRITYEHLGRITDRSATPTLQTAFDEEAQNIPCGIIIGAVNYERLLPSIRQLAKGVVWLHEAGKLHRDLKPSNVLVTPGGRVVILDFGLVAELVEQKNNSAEIVGTPAYMSPEQAAGLPVTAGTDWYSFGIMLYEAITGRFPFVGQMLDIMYLKQNFDAPPPATYIDTIPDYLNSLCVALLQRDPKDRPSGKEVLDRLDARTRSLSPLINTAARSLSLIGREQHLNDLREALLATQQGEAVTICVHGRSGMGKSELVRHFLQEVFQQEEALIFTGRCYERESVPYKAFDSLVDALSRYLITLPREQAEALLPPDLITLARLFPVLRQIEVVTEMAQMDIPDTQELRRRAFDALKLLLARLAQENSLVLFIDDLQWGDLDSAALLAELLQPPDAPKMLLITTYRSEEATTSACLREFLAACKSAGIAPRELTVGELSQDDARRLALKLIGMDVTNRLSQDLLTRAEMIARESGGSPFFIDELARYTQSLKITDAGVEVRTSLDEFIQARVMQLPEDARRLLEMVSVSGQPLSRTVARKAATLDQTEQSVIKLLRAGHLLRSTTIGDREELETYHDRIRETVVSHLSPEALKERHRQLAVTLEADGQADAERLASHFLAADLSEKATSYAIAAADHASDALAFDKAAQLYQLAIQLLPAESAAIKPLRKKLAIACAKAGRSYEAAQAFIKAADETDNVKEMVELQRAAAEHFLISGHIDDGVAVFRAFLPKVGINPPKTPGRTVFSLLTKRAFIQLRGLKYTERSEKEISPDDLIRIDTCWAGAVGMSVVDTILGADFQARHLLLALKAGEPYRVARALALEAGYVSTEGNRQRARTSLLLKEAKELAERLEHPHAYALALVCAGIAAFLCEGKWRKTVDLHSRAEKLLRERCHGVSWELNMSQLYISRTLIYLGELDELQRLLSKQIQDAHQRGDLFGEINLRTRAAYFLDLAADDAEKAERDLDSALNRWSQLRFHIQHYFAFIARGEIALYAGRPEAGLEWIEKQWPTMKWSHFFRLQHFVLESYCLRARCRLTIAAQNRSPQLLKEAKSDADRIEKEGMPWGNALVELLRAGIAAIEGKNDLAVELFNRAEESFKGVEMRLHMAAARRCRGQLLGGEIGRELVNSADEMMVAVKNPARMTAMLAPMINFAE